MQKATGHLTLESMAEAAWYNRWTINKFKKYLKGNILDVGCGIGNFTNELLKYGEVYAIDIKGIYLEKTKIATGGKAKVGFGDIEKGRFFFKNERFDSIVCLNVLEHIKSDKKALNYLSKLLNPNGHLIIIVPSHPELYGEFDKSIDHFRRYQKDQLKREIQNLGLKIIYAKRINFLGALGWWFSGKILKNKIVGEGKIRMFNLLAPFFLSLENIMEPPLGTSILIIAQKTK